MNIPTGTALYVTIETADGNRSDRVLHLGLDGCTPHIVDGSRIVPATDLGTIAHLCPQADGGDKIVTTAPVTNDMPVIPVTVLAMHDNGADVLVAQPAVAYNVDADGMWTPVIRGFHVALIPAEQHGCFVETFWFSTSEDAADFTMPDGATYRIHRNGDSYSVSVPKLGQFPSAAERTTHEGVDQISGAWLA